MDLRRLAHFVTVVEAGGLTRAATRLALSQPALSRQLALLEEEAGQRLLTRTGRGVVPTEAGVALLGHARAMLEIADRARDELRDLAASPRGRVTIGLPPRVAHVLAAPLVHRFRARFPHAVIAVAEALSLHLRDWLVAGRLDLALLFDPPASPLLDVRTLLREPLLVVAPASWSPLPTRVGVARLATLPLVLPSAGNALRTLVEVAARARGVALQVVAEVDSVHTIVSLVASGAGATVLPASGLATYGSADKLRVAALGPPAVHNRLVLAVPRSRPHTRLMRETVALVEALDFVGLERAPAPAGGSRRA